MCCQEKSCIFVNIPFYCQHELFFFFHFNYLFFIFLHIFILEVWEVLCVTSLTKRKRFLCAASWCACSSLTLLPHYEWFCVCVSGCQSGLAVQRWRAPQCLFVIDLIKENSPGLCTQRAWGSRHLDEKYSWSADFCRKTPVDKTQLWPTANSERKRGALKKKRTPEGCSQTYDEVDA